MMDVKSQWLWPLLRTPPMMPDAPGMFGAVRRYDIHTGVDLYTERGTTVVAVEDGYVGRVEDFTGNMVGTPWWNHTMAVFIEGPSGVVVYGEIIPCVGAADKIRAGDPIGVVQTSVLKVFKGRPMTMLHIEVMQRGSRETLWWHHGQPCPPVLKDPTEKLLEAAGADVRYFSMDTYCGEKYR